MVVSEKLQKVLARAGLGSRRFMEDVIAAGRITVNGQVAQIGVRVEPTDEVRVDGRVVNHKDVEETRQRVIVYYKPEGEVCTRTDPEGRPTVFEQLPQINDERWVMVGRLDINSTGLLLFTNDGDLANKLMHPSSAIERVYAVRVMGDFSNDKRQNLLDGVLLEDGPAKFEQVRELGGDGINRWYQVSVREGRNREVRRLFETQELKVSRLLRTRYGTVILPRELRTGRWLELEKGDVDALVRSVDLKPRVGTGLYGMAKRRQERMYDNPLPARRPTSHPRTEGSYGTPDSGYNARSEYSTGYTPRSHAATVTEQKRSSQYGRGLEEYAAQRAMPKTKPLVTRTTLKPRFKDSEGNVTEQFTPRKPFNPFDSE